MVCRQVGHANRDRARMSKSHCRCARVTWHAGTPCLDLNHEQASDICTGLYTG